MQAGAPDFGARPRATRWAEAVQQNPIQILALQLGLDSAADHAGSAAENRDGCSVSVGVFGQQFLFCRAALLPERMKLERIELLGKRLRDGVRQGGVDVVAAQQDVIADRDALERDFAACSLTAIRVKSVVPPPMSITRIRSPTPTSSRQSGLRSIQA